MDIKNQVNIDTKTVNEQYTTKLQAKEDKLATGKKLAEQGNNEAVSLKITAKSGDVSDIAMENILSASSSITDVSKAEEMIREANKRILDQANYSMLTQSNQTVEVASELLK